MVAVSIPEMLGGEVSDTTLCISAGVAEVVLLAALLLQLSATPYPFRFQNRLEVFLLGCSMLVVLLGVIYAFVAVKSVAVEAALLTVLFGSMVGAALFIVVKHCREQPGSRLATRPAPATLQRGSDAEAAPPGLERRDSPAGLERRVAPAGLELKKRLSAIGERLTPPFMNRGASSCTLQESSVEGPVLSRRGSAEDGGGKMVMYGGEMRSLGAMI